MANCDMCGEDVMDFDDLNSIQGLNIYVCRRCEKEIEDHHTIDGKYVVVRCKECGKIRTVDWKPYKQKGRPKGSKNQIKTNSASIESFGKGMA